MVAVSGQVLSAHQATELQDTNQLSYCRHIPTLAALQNRPPSTLKGTAAHGRPMTEQKKTARWKEEQTENTTS